LPILPDVHALVFADRQLRDAPAERGTDPALGDLDVGEFDLGSGTVHRRLRDLDLDLARRLQGLQALLRLEAAPCGLELGATDLQASLLLGAVECDQRRARAEGIAEPAAEPLD